MSQVARLFPMRGTIHLIPIARYPLVTFLTLVGSHVREIGTEHVVDPPTGTPAGPATWFIAGTASLLGIR